ncbi:MULTISPECIES: phage tail-collar fiber domain-containing protein [Pseudomonas]|uniref:phage tail-collar fiber domain-containing protein n=1 Tax=Pseudomonas TaxID=286 RepID=UPI000349C8C5|nr:MULTISPECIES: phage tail protein [Pseudomonas]
MADYYTLLTDAGIAYETACKAAGTPIKLSQISVGDGGGAVYNPAATATALKREVWRGPLNALFQDEKNPSWLLAEVTIPSDVGGWYVREAGIWTDTGILYAIVKYPESFKPVLATSGSGKEFYIRSIFETSNAELVTLLIDDTVVKATRVWVMSYLADELAKLDGKQSVRVATTGNIVLSGAQQIDGVAVVSGQRVLVVAQTSAKDNGIYIVANGAWVRSADCNSSSKVTPGLTVVVEEGVTYGDSLWHLVTNNPITLGATALTFEMLAGRTGIAAGTYKSLTVDKYGRATAGSNPETLSGFGIKDSYTKAEIEALIAKSSSLPVGAQVAFQTTVAPAGFLEMDGSLFDPLLYPQLAAFLGSNRLPDYRGMVPRGWDHGRGIDPGRDLGSEQSDALQNISGSFYTRATDQVAGDVLTPTGAFKVVVDGSLTGIKTISTTQKASYNVMFDASLSARTAAETRMRNVATMWCIKAWSAATNQGTIDVAVLANKVGKVLPVGYLTGLRMWNSIGSPDTVVNVDPGAAKSSDNGLDIVLPGNWAAGLLPSGAWSAGSGAQKLDMGVREANAWYHLFLIRKNTNGTGELLFSLSPTAPILPSDYSGARRIGSVRTDASGNITSFINVGRSFWWSMPIKDASGSLPANSNASVSLVLSVPPGVRVLVKNQVAFTGSSSNIYLRPTDSTAITTTWLVANNTASVANWNGGLGMNTSDVDFGSVPFETLSNTISQVVMQYQSAAMNGLYAVMTLGWTELD